MSGKFAPIGQFMPSSRAAASSLPKYSSGKPGNLSFQEVLNRHHTTSVESNLQAPQYSQRLQSRPVSSRSVASNPQPMPKTQALPPEAVEMAQKVPTDFPQGGTFEQAIMQNLRDYEEMKKTTAGKSQANQSMFPTADDIRAGKNSDASSAEKAMGAAFNAQPYAGESRNVPRFRTSESVNQASDAVPVIYPEPAEKSRVAENRNLFESDARNRNMNRRASDDAHTAVEQKPKRKGFFGAIGSFFKDVASALTFGIYRPEGEKAPKGLGRVVYPFKKLIYDAPIKDLAMGVPMGIYHDIGSAVNQGEKEERGQEPRQQRKTAITGTASRDYANRPRWTRLPNQGVS